MLFKLDQTRYIAIFLGDEIVNTCKLCRQDGVNDILLSPVFVENIVKLRQLIETINK